jgi:hypothetical protein
MIKKSVFSSSIVLLFTILIMIGNMFVNNGLAFQNFDEWDDDYDGNESPHAVACDDPWGYTGVTNENIILDGSASYDNNPGDYIAYYSWDLGAGWTPWSSSPTIVYRNKNGGNYSIYLKVMDSYGQISFTDEAYVNINPNGSQMQVDIEDNHPIFGWCEGEIIVFTLDVDVIGSGSIWWFDIDLEVLNEFDPVAPYKFYYRSSHEDPFEPNDPIWREYPTWMTIVGDTYWIKADLDWGYSTDDSPDPFWVHWCPSSGS